MLYVCNNIHDLQLYIYACCDKKNIVVHQENEKRIKKNNEKAKNSILEGNGDYSLNQSCLC